MTDGASETRIASLHRLAMAREGARLWRNNVGVLVDKTGRPVRYGLANESKAMNEQIKSSDFIGWRTVIVTPDMVGKPVAIFVSHETKEEGWHLTPGDKRGQAQAAWGRMVTGAGGEFRFVTDVPDA